MAKRTGPRFSRAVILIPFANEFDRRGGDLTKVLSNHHISLAVLDQPNAPIDALSMYAAIESMAELLGDRYFGATVAMEAAYHGTPMLKDAAEGATTFGEFLTRVIMETADRVDNVRYSLLVLPVTTTFEIQRQLRPTGPVKQVDAIGVAFYVTAIKLGLRQHFNIGQVVVTTPTDDGIPPSFLPKRSLIKSPINGLRISFPTSWLAAPFSLDWTALAELSNESPVETPGFPTQSYLKELLKSSFDQGDLDLDSFCKKCGMHPRNFQRFLAGQGTSYRQMKDELRHALAIELLSSSDRSIAEVATQTGFSSPAAFDRAFKRWTGETPSSCRRKLGGS